MKKNILNLGMFLFVTLSGCNQNMDIGSPLTDPNAKTDQCPVFDLNKMQQSGITFPAEVEGYLVVPPYSTTECTGSRGYKFLLVYSPVVPTGSMEVTPNPIPGFISTRYGVSLAYELLPLTDEVKFKIRDALLGNRNLFNTSGSLRAPRSLDTSMDLVLNGDTVFATPQYSPQKNRIAFDVSDTKEGAATFVQNFNAGLSSINLFHDWTGPSSIGTGLNDFSRFYVSELYHPAFATNPGKKSALRVLTPLEAMARIWPRAALQMEKQSVIARAIQWFSRISLDGSDSNPMVTAMLDYSRSNWNPKPDTYDNWAFDSLAFINLVAPSPESKLTRLKALKISEVEGDKYSALRQAAELVLSHPYTPEQEDAVLTLARRIKSLFSGIQSPWKEARSVFDSLKMNAAQSQVAVTIALWLSQQNIFSSSDISACFDSAVAFAQLDSANGLAFETAKKLYTQVIQWEGLSSQRLMVWNEVKLWVFTYDPTPDAMEALGNFYAWFISPNGTLMSPDSALIAARGYVFGKYHANASQIEVFKSTVAWLRGAAIAELLTNELILAKAQSDVFDKGMDAAKLELLKQSFLAHLPDSITKILALEKAEKEVLGS